MEYKIPNYILASKTTRFLNFAIDLIFLHLIRAIIYIVSAFVPFNKEYITLLEWFNSFGKLDNYLFFSLLMFVYYSIFEIFTARTLSKYFTNTIVVIENGLKPSPNVIIA